MIDVETAHKLSIYNRSAIGDAGEVGCFCCIRTFPSSAVTQWADKGTTAICPNCGVDSLLPGRYSTEDLTAMCERWFKPVRPETVSAEPPK